MYYHVYDLQTNALRNLSVLKHIVVLERKQAKQVMKILLRSKRQPNKNQTKQFRNKSSDSKIAITIQDES